MLPTHRVKPKIEFCPTVACGRVAQKGVCEGGGLCTHGCVRVRDG